MDKPKVVVLGVLGIVILALVLKFALPLMEIQSDYIEPLKEKRATLNDLYSAETFITELGTKIDEIATNGGSEELPFNIVGEIIINDAEDRIEIVLKPTGSSYAPEGFVCFIRNCDTESGVLGEDSPAVIGAETKTINESLIQTTYILQERVLKSDNETYQINIVTPNGGEISGKEGDSLRISNKGKQEGEATIVNVLIEIL